MISTYRLIGKTRMEYDGFSNLPPAQQKKYVISQFCTEDSAFSYKDKRKGDQPRMVLMNLDTVNKSISFTSGAQIGPGFSAQNLIFRNYAPADPNIYANHVGYKSIMSFMLMEYIQTNRKKIKWSAPDEIDSCIDYLNKIRQDFFVEDKYGLRPNYRLLPEDQQEGFPDPETAESLQDIFDDKKIKKAWGKANKDYFSKNLADITGERQAYAITIDGKYMHEVEEVAPCYLDVLHYHILGKQFADSKHKGFCHLCSAETNLANDVYLKQKFYGVTSRYYFDGAKASMSKNAFSMCQDCYDETVVGIQYASSKLRTRILGLDCLVLPELDLQQNGDEELIDPKNLKAIPNLLQHQRKEEQRASLDIVKNLMNKLNNFTLFFYYKPSPTSQEFIINRLIKSISLSSVADKNEDLYILGRDNDLVDIFNEYYGLSFEGLRFLILPSSDSHPNLKAYEYQKINRDMLNLLSAYLYSQKLDYSLLVKRFVDIFSRKHNHAKGSSTYRLDLSPFIMSLYLKHLINFNQLRSPRKMEEKPMTTTLEDPKLIEYFDNHPDVYADNYPAQGLFILGWYLADLEYEQRKKGINRTAINKLNLRGIPLQKVKTVMASIDDLRQVWKVYHDAILDAYYRECMADIEHSGLSPEEVVYHILSGRAYRSYVGIKIGKEKKQDKINQEAQND